MQLTSVSSVEYICTCSCRLHMTEEKNVIMNFISTSSWIACYLEFLKVWCAACIAKQTNNKRCLAIQAHNWWRVHIGCPDLLESPITTFGSFFRTGPVSVLRSLTPQPQRPLCLIMTRTTVITTITPDHREAGMRACVPWHGSVGNHKYDIYVFLINVIGASTSVKPCYSMANMRQEYWYF